MMKEQTLETTLMPNSVHPRWRIPHHKHSSNTFPQPEKLIHEITERQSQPRQSRVVAPSIPICIHMILHRHTPSITNDINIFLNARFTTIATRIYNFFNNLIIIIIIIIVVVVMIQSSAFYANFGESVDIDIKRSLLLDTREWNFLELMDPPLLDNSVPPGESGGGGAGVGILKQGVVERVKHVEVGSEHFILPNALLVEPVAPSFSEGGVFEQQGVLNCGHARRHGTDGEVHWDVVGGEGGFGRVIIIGGGELEGEVVVGGVMVVVEGGRGRGEEGAADGGREGVEV